MSKQTLDNQTLGNQTLGNQTLGNQPTNYKRFDGRQRTEHALLLLSFTVLSITGLPQMYSTTYWGSWLIWLFGGRAPVAQHDLDVMKLTKRVDPLGL